MTDFGKTLPVLFALVCRGALGVGGYFALEFLIVLFGRLDFRVGAATALASVIVLLAAMIIARSIRQASTQNTANQLRAEQAMTYQRCTALWGCLLWQGHGAEATSSNSSSDELLHLLFSDTDQASTPANVIYQDLTPLTPQSMSGRSSNLPPSLSALEG